MMKHSEVDLVKLEAIIKEKELRSEKQYRELKSSLAEVKEQLFSWSG